MNKQSFEVFKNINLSLINPPSPAQRPQYKKADSDLSYMRLEAVVAVKLPRKTLQANNTISLIMPCKIVLEESW